MNVWLFVPSVHSFAKQTFPQNICSVEMSAVSMKIMNKGDEEMIYPKLLNTKTL